MKGRVDACGHCGSVDGARGTSVDECGRRIGSFCCTCVGDCGSVRDSLSGPLLFGFVIGSGFASLGCHGDSTLRE